MKPSVNERTASWLDSFSLPSPLSRKKDQNRFEGVRQAGLLSTIPALLVISPLLGFFIGRFLDGKLNTDPVLTIVLLVLGFTAGAIQIARVVRLANRDSDEKD